MTLRRVRSQSPDVNALQDALDVEFRRIAESVTSSPGVSVTVPVPSAGSVVLPHGLGRAPRGWIVTDIERAATATANVSVYRRAGGLKTVDRLELYVTNPCTLTVWVY